MTLDPVRHRLEGRATIDYRSGADSTLNVLYLHAYPNAFSGPRTLYAREREQQGQDFDMRFGKPGDYGWMALDSASVDGRPAEVRVNETVATLFLPRPLAPRRSARISLRFTVQVPKHFDRLGRTGNAYTVTQWYPKMAVYDDSGWHADPFHYMAEFYGDFGTFDVTIHVPDDYWVGATGLMTSVSGGDNQVPLFDQDVPKDSVDVTVHLVTADSLAGAWPSRSLVLETDLPRVKETPSMRATVQRDKPLRLRVPRATPVHYVYSWDQGRADARDEADPVGCARPWRLILAERDTTITDTLRALAAKPASGDTVLPSMKALRFHAERVHDFAWVASPDYVRRDTTWSGIAVRTLAFRENQERWAEGNRYVVDALQHHTEVVGPYRYPQFTLTEAWCGGGAMEYPMLVTTEPDVVSDRFYDLDDVTAHEVGHNWFYGMLGSDERTYPWLDEGFSQWVEDTYTDRKYPRGLFRKAGRFPWLTPKGAFTADELSYLSRAWARDERPMTTPAERYESYRDYAVASYSKPVSMLRTLRGVIGEEAFGKFLQGYFRNNLFRHPLPADVFRAAEQASYRDLDRFFHDWTATTKQASYAMGATTSHRADAGRWQSRVEVRRRGDLVVPVTVEARFADGTRQTAVAPGDARSSFATFESSSRLKSAVLDPRHDLVEMDRLDNGRPFPVRFRPLFDFPQTEEITALYGPTIWHGRREGMRLGGWIEGRYLPMRDFPRGVAGFEGGWNIGSRDGVQAWRFGWWRRQGWLGARGQIRLLAARDAGLTRIEATLGNLVTATGRRYPWRTWWVGAQIRDRFDLAPVDARYWSPGRTVNVSAGLRIETVGPRRESRLTLEARRGVPAFLESGAPETAASYDWVRAELQHDRNLGRFHLGVRGFGGSAWRRVPREQQFDVAEGSRLDALDRFYENDRGPLRATGHYLAEGGGGLRGYAGRAGLGERIAAVNLTVDDGATGAFAFADAGRAEASGLGAGSRPATHPLIGRPLADLGVGYRYGPATLMLPLWVGRPEAGDRPWKVRWRVSLDLQGIHPWW